MINSLLINAFDKEAFTEFVQKLIPNLSINEKRVETRTGFKSIQQIAETNENDLDLVAFIAEPDSSLSARVEIVKNAYAVLKNHARSNALIAYITDDSSEWRLSLITTNVTRTEKGIKQTISNPRRFSYVLGPNAKVKTPDKFLIRQGSIIDLEDLKNRFSMEVVNKDFYKQIALCFTKLVGGIRSEGRNQQEYKAQLKLPSVPDRSQINNEFAVRLIGRIIFCWFLREKVSSAGISLMPKKLLSLEAIADFSDYYHSILEPIFFELLNKPIRSRRDGFINEEFSSIPYLNGGLFSPQEDDFYSYNEGKQAINHNTVIVPDEWVAEFFEILEQYNFTIDENTTFDEELSIDPEMLGRIFENLLAEINPETGESARKSTGSYYTPRAIVDYMIDESLLLYLQNETKIDEEKLRAVISYDLTDDETHPLANGEKSSVTNSLEKIKILDPACGSGAFPIGALQKIVFILQQVDPNGQLWFKKQIESTSPEIKRVMEREFEHQNFDYIRKLGIIRENIYGIDIQPIASEISRLRCFLTLVVDQNIQDTEENRGIEPLPNLDFKFVTANSLIGLPNIEDTGQKELFDDREKIDDLKSIRDQYFTASGIEREQLKTEFVMAQKKLVDQLIKEHGFMGVAKAELTQKLTDWEPFSHKSSTWFDPEWMFGIKEGFHVIIANPPYVGEKGHKDIFREIKNGTLSEYYQGKMDLFYFFFHLAINLGSLNSQVAFITTNYYPTATGAKRLRQDFKERSIIINLINFNELKIFESALGQHNMITILSKNQNEDFLAETSITKRTGVATPEILESIVSGQDEETEYFEVAQRDLYDGEEQYIRLTGNFTDSGNMVYSILEKIKLNNERLDSIFNINSGVDVTISKITNHHLLEFQGNFEYNSGVFVITKEEAASLGINDEEKKIIKRFIKNSDIYSYGVRQAKDLLIYLTWGDEIGKYPNIKRHLFKYIEILKDQQKRYEEKYPWFALHRPREQNIFESNEKILVPYRSKKNIFGYSTDPIYASRDVFFITNKSSQIALKYALALLNSRLYYLWLYHRGKKKGETLELYQTPLSEIPIKKVSIAEQKPFIEIVDKILVITQDEDYLQNSAKQEEVHKHEKQIDQMVYKLYDLTPEEIAIVEGDSK